MKYKSGFIIGLLLLIGMNLIGQTIIADKTSGCDSISVTFSISPPAAIGASISWNFGNGVILTGNPSPNVMYDKPGHYTVSCLIDNTTTIIAPDLITVYKTPSAVFLFNDSLVISPYFYAFRHILLPADTGILSFEWQFSDGTSEITPNVEHIFLDAGNYDVTLIVTTSVGCTDTSSRRIGVSNLLEVPNVFTPNDDAVNDYFKVRTDGISTYIFSVYTRSGVLIYRSESPTILWDGRSFSGQVLSQGIYYYIIEQKGGSSVNAMKGILYLLR